MDDDGSGLPLSAEGLQAFIEETEAKVLSLQGSIVQEETKMEKYRVYPAPYNPLSLSQTVSCQQLENICRRHNYLPLIMEILKILAKRGELVPLCEQVSILLVYSEQVSILLVYSEQVSILLVYSEQVYMVIALPMAGMRYTH